MLVRIAQNLYWTGRYLQRTSHLAKFLRVQYFSTLDASMVYNLEFTLRSIMNMAGIQEENPGPLQEQETLLKVGFDLDNPASLYSTITLARENARSIQHIISRELWESINKLYHFTKSYPQDFFKKEGLYDFTLNIEEHSKVIESNMRDTLLRNDQYYFMLLGARLENIIQITRILKSKLMDAVILSENGENLPLLRYQWTITLKCLESFDMHNQYYRNNMSIKSVVEFVVANPYLPRSLYANMKSLNKVFDKVSVKPEGLEDVQFGLAKLENQLRFYEYEDNDQLHSLLDEVSRTLSGLHEDCASLYFNE